MKCLKLAILILFYLILSIFFYSCDSTEVKKSKEFIEAAMYSEAIDLLNIEIQQNPKNAEAQHLLGYVYLLINRENKANEYFHRSELLDTDYIKERANTYFKAGNILIGQNPKLAIHYFDTSIEKKSDLKENASNSCLKTAKEFLLSSEKYRWGLNLLDKSLEYNPSLLPSISSYCVTSADKEYINNNFDKAVALLNYAKDQSDLSKKNNLLIKIGFQFWKQGKLSNAKFCFSDAINNGANIENNDSLYYAFYIDLSRQNLQISDLDKFLEIFPKSSFYPEVQYLKGDLLFNSSDFKNSKIIMVNLSDHYNTSKWGKLADQKLDFWPITKSGIEVVFNEKWILPKKNKIIKVTNLTGNSILADYPPIRALFEQKQHEEKLYYDSNSIKFFSKSPNTHITITIYKDKNGNTIVIAKK